MELVIRFLSKTCPGGSLIRVQWSLRDLNVLKQKDEVRQNARYLPAGIWCATQSNADDMLNHFVPHNTCEGLVLQIAESAN